MNTEQHGVVDGEMFEVRHSQFNTTHLDKHTAYTPRYSIQSPHHYYYYSNRFIEYDWRQSVLLHSVRHTNEIDAVHDTAAIKLNKFNRC